MARSVWCKTQTDKQTHAHIVLYCSAIPSIQQNGKHESASSVISEELDLKTSMAISRHSLCKGQAIFYSLGMLVRVSDQDEVFDRTVNSLIFQCLHIVNETDSSRGTWTGTALMDRSVKRADLGTACEIPRHDCSQCLLSSLLRLRTFLQPLF